MIIAAATISISWRASSCRLRHELKNPQRIALFAQEYHAERRRLVAHEASQQGQRENELASTDRKIARMVDALADGLVAADSIRDKLLSLEAERMQLVAQLAAIPRALAAVDLHPTAITRYLSEVERLADALSREGSAAGSAAELVRSLIERVIVHPVPTRAPLDVEVRGYLAHLLDAPGFAPNGRLPVSGGINGAG